MTKAYRVMFLGLRNGEDQFRKKMAGVGVSSDMVQGMIQKAPMIMKEWLHLRDARSLAESIQEAGGRVTIQEQGVFGESKRFDKQVEIAPFEDFILCPECGFIQRKAGACAKCRFPLTKMDREEGNDGDCGP